MSAPILGVFLKQLYGSLLDQALCLLDLYFPPEWLKAAMVLALLSTWVLVGLYAYLNRYTRRPYFALWTVGWLFYTLWLTSSIIFLDVQNPSHWEWIRLSCIGICAIFLFWGALRFWGMERGQREMGLTVLLMVLWSFVAKDHLNSKIWLTVPLFVILSLSGFFISVCFFHRRLNHRYIGAGLLGFGFLLWGAQMFFQPLMEASVLLRPTGFVSISIIQLLIAVGMIVLVLEEVRSESLSLRDQLKADVRLTRCLKREIEISENRYEHLFQQANEGIFIVDPASLQILEVNRRAQAMTGYSREELLRLRFVNVCSFLRDHESAIAREPGVMQKIFATYGNIPLERKDGNVMLTEGNCSVLEETRGSTVEVFLREVTERRRLEQQLRQAEKLSALGQLISGVAHELNNPLAVISGYAQLLAMRPSVEKKTRDDLFKIQRESERASKIVQNFLTFARKQPSEKSNVSLNLLVNVSLELMDYDLRASGIRLVKELQVDLPEVFADPNQMQQVLLNLISNSVQAMEGSAREKVLIIRSELVRDFVCLSVTDQGHGIPASILNRIFDPFFTTKDAGAGTGLGLSISYSIVKEHLGNLSARNNPEGGATFTVEIPISHMRDIARPSSQAMERPRVVPALARKIFEVLVVDDEIAIQEVFSELLVDMCCRVQGASNGNHALQLVEHQDFDLIICDLKMPSMDGRRFFSRVREVKPHLVRNIIFITGDTNSPKTIEFLQQSGNRWITKPFNFREVQEIFSEHLAHAQKTGFVKQPEGVAALASS